MLQVTVWQVCGRLLNQGLLTFNSLNSFILKGDAAQGMEFTFASLMARAYDEPDAMYGLAARGVQISSDRLRPRGETPLPAEGFLPDAPSELLGDKFRFSAYKLIHRPEDA